MKKKKRRRNTKINTELERDKQSGEKRAIKNERKNEKDVNLRNEIYMCIWSSIMSRSDIYPKIIIMYFLCLLKYPHREREQATTERTHSSELNCCHFEACVSCIMYKILKPGLFKMRTWHTQIIITYLFACLHTHTFTCTQRHSQQKHMKPIYFMRNTFDGYSFSAKPLFAIIKRWT